MLMGGFHANTGLPLYRYYVHWLLGSKQLRLCLREASNLSCGKLKRPVHYVHTLLVGKMSGALCAIVNYSASILENGRYHACAAFQRQTTLFFCLACDLEMKTLLDTLANLYSSRGGGVVIALASRSKTA